MDEASELILLPPALPVADWSTVRGVLRWRWRLHNLEERLESNP